MRTVCTIWCLGILTFLQAQDLSLSQDVWELSTGEEIDWGQLSLTNNGGEEVDIAITLEKVCKEVDDMTNIQIYFVESCFFPVDTTTTWGDTTDSDDILLSLKPGETTSDIKFNPYFEVDEFGSEWNLIFFEIGNPDNHATLNVRVVGECTLVSTKNLVQLDQDVFPNPANEVINIPFQGFEQANELIIFNSLGIIQESITLNQSFNTLSVDISNYAEGVYFYQLTDGDKSSRAKAFLKR